MRAPLETVLDSHWLVLGAESTFCCFRPVKERTGAATADLLEAEALAEVAAKEATDRDWTATEEAIAAAERCALKCGRKRLESEVGG